jgi:hypothetical protein
MNKVNSFLTVFIVLLFKSGLLSAQMFSVKSEKKEDVQNESSLIISAGTTFMDFSYSGNTPSDYRFNSGQFAFNDPVYYLHGQFGLVHFHIDYGNSLGPANQLRYSNLSLTFMGSLQLTRNKQFHLAIPLHLTTDSFTISSSNIGLDETRFEQTGFTFGTGIETSLRLHPWLGISLSQLFHYGFAARGIGGNYGSKTLIETKVIVQTFRIWNDSRLSIHGGYLYHVYDLDSFLFDYRLNALTFGLGLSF